MPTFWLIIVAIAATGIGLYLGSQSSGLGVVLIPFVTGAVVGIWFLINFLLQFPKVFGYWNEGDGPDDEDMFYENL